MNTNLKSITSSQRVPGSDNGATARTRFGGFSNGLNYAFDFVKNQLIDFIHGGA